MSPWLLWNRPPPCESFFQKQGHCHFSHLCTACHTIDTRELLYTEQKGLELRRYPSKWLNLLQFYLRCQNSTLFWLNLCWSNWLLLSFLGWCISTIPALHGFINKLLEPFWCRINCFSYFIVQILVQKLGNLRHPCYSCQIGWVKSGCFTALRTLRSGIPNAKRVIYKPKELKNR